MNKKIKTYSTLFVVAIILVIVTNTFHYNWHTSYCSSDKDTLELVDEPREFVSVDTIVVDSTKGAKKYSYRTTHHPVISYTVNVMPNQVAGEKVLMSDAMGERYKVNMKTVDLLIPLKAQMNPVDKYQHSRLGISLAVYNGIIIAVSLFIFIWILVIVLKTIRSIRRGEVFVSQVSRNLEKSGILLVALYIVDLVGSYAITMYYANHIHIGGYHVVFVNSCNSMYIITGFALMIISQVILMGKELKDEQELTI